MKGSYGTSFSYYDNNVKENGNINNYKRVTKRNYNKEGNIRSKRLKKLFSDEEAEVNKILKYNYNPQKSPLKSSRTSNTPVVYSNTIFGDKKQSYHSGEERTSYNKNITINSIKVNIPKENKESNLLPEIRKSTPISFKEPIIEANKINEKDQNKINMRNEEIVKFSNQIPSKVRLEKENENQITHKYNKYYQPNKRDMIEQDIYNYNNKIELMRMSEYFNNKKIQDELMESINTKLNNITNITTEPQGRYKYNDIKDEYKKRLDLLNERNSNYNNNINKFLNSNLGGFEEERKTNGYLPLICNNNF